VAGAHRSARSENVARIKILPGAGNATSLSNVKKTGYPHHRPWRRPQENFAIIRKKGIDEFVKGKRHWINKKQ
jgi:hypothetical protein